jgi:cytochrome P450
LVVDGYLERFDQTPVRERWALVRRWMFEEPLPFYAELRKCRPILVMPELVLATRHADCSEILRRFDVFSVGLYRPKQGEYWMAQDDTANHWREKSIMRAILDREDIPAIRTYVESKAVELLRVARGRIDAVNGLTRAIPIALVQDWFGFVDSDPAELQRWSYWNQMDAFWNQPFDSVAVADPAQVVEERKAANAAMRDYLIGLVRRRAAELQAGAGGNDPVSRLLRLSFSKALKFEIDRVVLNLGGLLIGAVETTSHACVNALDGLLHRAESLDAARAAAAAGDLSRFDGYVFEALRFRPAFPYFFRVCEQDTLLARGTDYQTPVAVGQTVLAVTHAAMFDDVAFACPDEFDPDRERSSMFHFGLGLHECLGRAIGNVMIPEIARQALLLPDLHVGPVDRNGGPVPEHWAWRWREPCS